MAEELRVCMPPDPNPRAPGYTLPANACDCHFHLFGLGGESVPRPPRRSSTTA